MHIRLCDRWADPVKFAGVLKIVAYRNSMKVISIHSYGLKEVTSA